MNKNLNDFEAESLEYLEDCIQTLFKFEQLIIALTSSKDSNDSIIKIKRIIHTLKGTAGSYGFPLISSVCHKVEDLFSTDESSSQLNEDFIDSLLNFNDVLTQICKAYADQDKQVLSQIKKKFAIVDEDDKSEKTLPIENENEHKCKILVIEPTKMLYGKIKKSLSDLNADISISKDGYEGLGRLLREKFDIIITSVHLPMIDAVSLFSVLDKISHLNKNVKKIIMTSTKDKTNLNELTNASVIDKGPLLEKDVRKIVGDMAKPKPTEDKTDYSRAFNLLLIDDAQEVHKLVDFSFAKFKKIKITHCLESVSAERVAIEAKPDCILLDVQMPDVSGEIVFKILKSNPVVKNIPIIFLTAMDSPVEVKRLVELGGKKVIKKPFSPKALALAVINSIDSK